VNPLAATLGPSAYWYLTRASGTVALILLTAAVALGVIDVRRFNAPGWPRFVIDALHRNVALLAMVFLVLHILTAVLDSFASIRLIDAIIPFVGSYRPFWLGLGAAAFDLLLAIIVTSLLRGRIGLVGWRAVHWATYASWPIAVLHTVGTGSDIKSAWMLLVVFGCLAVTLGAVGVRAVGALQTSPAHARAALGVTAAFTLFFVLWLPGGPLGADWAARSGTPTALLSHHPATRNGQP